MYGVRAKEQHGVEGRNPLEQKRQLSWLAKTAQADDYVEDRKAEMYHEIAVPKEESKEEEMEGEKVQVGPCLIIKGALTDGTAITIIVDSGAGVTIVGKKFIS